MKKLQPWIALDAHPYDTSTTKVREGANPSQRHLEGSVPVGHHVCRGCQTFDVALVHVAEEFHGQMQLVGVHPRQIRLDDAQRGQGMIERGSQGIVQLNREEEAHAHQPDRRPAPPPRA